MEFDNEFTVQAPVEEVYEALLDLERVTPAMPGAQVLEKVDDDNYKVAIKVKLGPVSMTYRGDVSIVERDPETHSAVLDVKAKEARGQGSATAKVTMSLKEQGAETTGTMHAQVQLAGKAAAMGRGVIEDVSRRLVETFAGNLEGILGSQEEETEDEAPAPAPAAAAAAEDEGLSVAPLAAGMAADRMRDPKVLGAVLGGVLLLGYVLGRRS